MVRTIFLHRVRDFNAWKNVFDSKLSLRRQYGELSYSVGNVHGEPNYAYVINEWESIEAFNRFRNSTELQESMKTAGVLEEPKVTILDLVHETVTTV